MRHFLAGVTILPSLYGCRTGLRTVKDADGNFDRLQHFHGRESMMENLRESVTGSQANPTSRAPGDDTGHIRENGRLYDFETACRIRPKGWHLPTITEREALINTPGMTRLLHATPAGCRNPGEFGNLFGEAVVFRTSSRADDHIARGVVLEVAADAFRIAPQHPEYGFPVRCVKDR
jgi:hypothetical protein